MQGDSSVHQPEGLARRCSALWSPIAIGILYPLLFLRLAQTSVSAADGSGESALQRPGYGSLAASARTLTGISQGRRHPVSRTPISDAVALRPLLETERSLPGKNAGAKVAPPTPHQAEKLVAPAFTWRRSLPKIDCHISRNAACGENWTRQWCVQAERAGQAFERTIRDPRQRGSLIQ